MDQLEPTETTMQSKEIIMFTGPNCSACKTMKPLVEELSNARIVDVTQDHALAARYGIRGGLPAFVKLVNGEFSDRANGAMTPLSFNNWVGK